MPKNHLRDERIPHDLRLAAHLAALALVEAEIEHTCALMRPVPDNVEPGDAFWALYDAVYPARAAFRDAHRAIYRWLSENPELPTQAEIDNGPHAHLGTVPSDYAKD